MFSDLLKKLKSDTLFRTRLFLLLSLIFNFGYAIFLFVVSRIYFSKWFFVMSIYYALLSVARIFLFFEIQSNGSLRKKNMDYARLRLFPTRAQSRRFDNGLSFDLHHAAGNLPSNRRDNASNLYVFRLNDRHRQYREVFETKQSRLFPCKGDKPNLRQRFYADVDEYDARNLRRRQYPTAEYHSTHL